MKRLAAVEDVLVAVTDSSVVRIAAESELDSASVSAYAGSHSPLASRGRYASFCACEPGSLSPSEPNSCTASSKTTRRADLRDLLDRDQGEQRAGARASPLLVEEQPEQLVLAKDLDHVPRKLVRLVDRSRTRRDALARERADELANLALLLGQDVPGHAFDCTALAAGLDLEADGKGAGLEHEREILRLPAGHRSR